MIKCFRHQDVLIWGSERIIAPREFVIDDKVYFIHIHEFNFEFKAVIYYKIKDIDETTKMLSLYSLLKIYTNSKGEYINFKSRDKIVRIYLGV